MLDSEESHPSREREDVPNRFEAVDCPTYWKNADCTTDFDERYNLSKRLVKQFQELFDRTFKDIRTRDRVGAAPLALTVVSAQRIEDRNMWVQYVEQKQRISEARGACCTPLHRLSGSGTGFVKTAMPAGNGASFQDELDSDLNEFYLFHGTSPEGARGISEDGFRLDLSGSNAGNMFGKGAYFAECSSKSDEYAQEGKGIYKGIYALLLCRVCCGELFRLTARDDAAVEAALKGGRYDSVLGDREASVGTYREFVVYRARQIYPEYVVLYKRVLPDEDEDGSDSS